MRIYSQSTLNLKWEKKKEKKTVKERRKNALFQHSLLKVCRRKRKKDWFSLKESFSVCLRHSHIILFTGSHIDGAACWVCNTVIQAYLLHRLSLIEYVFSIQEYNEKENMAKTFSSSRFVCKVLSNFFRFFFRSWSKDPASHLSLFSTSIDSESKTKSHFMFEWGKTSQISKFCGIFLKSKNSCPV